MTAEGMGKLLAEVNTDLTEHREVTADRGEGAPMRHHDR